MEGETVAGVMTAATLLIAMVLALLALQTKEDKQ
jgi:hypothetical protein